MLQMLKPGETLNLVNGATCRVHGLIGSGGQGEVYEVELGSSRYALKWYYPHCADHKQLVGLQDLVKRGAPSDQFLWPMDVIVGPDGNSFGYLMRLRSKEYKSINDLMTRKAEPSFRTLCNVGIQLTDNFLRLHMQGLCYRDISFGNVFFHPDSGEVLICDNDNVAVDGDEECSVLGTPRFMAPEIVRGKAKPSSDTDRFSLAVLLFYMFMLHHPLEGKREMEIHSMDLPAMRRLYGEQPLFIWHPVDRSNAPVPGYQDNALIYWGIYPEALKTLFIQAFTDGLDDAKNGRVRESQWRKAFRHLRDSLFHCPYCSAENFYDKNKLQTNQPTICWHCQKLLPSFPLMQVGEHMIVLDRESKIYNYHLGGTNGTSADDMIAEMVQHPQNPAVWGMRNHGRQTWSVERTDGTILVVPPGKSFHPSVGTKVNFGNGVGVISQ